MDTHPWVRALQRALINAGYDIDEIDGEFGDATADALEEFQEDVSLPETGEMALGDFVSVPRHAAARVDPVIALQYE